MDYAIQNLMNMEAALGYGFNPNVPSAINGYRMTPNNSYGIYNPNLYAGINNGIYTNNGINPTFNGLNSATAGQQATGGQNSIFQGIQKQDVDTLTKYYTKSLDPSESFLGCLAGATGFGILFHPRAIAHPFNTKSAFKATTEMFKNEGKLAELWKSHNPLMQDAYTAMHRIEARALPKLGLFRKTLDSKTYAELKDIMATAIKSGDIAKIAEATELLNGANVWDGPVGRFTKLIRGKERLTPQQALENTRLGVEAKSGFLGRGLEKLGKLFGFGKGAVESAEISGTEKFAQKVAQKVEEGANPTFKTALKKAGGKGFILFAAMNLLMGMQKIKTAYSKDKKTGTKQLGQTVFKSVTDAAGWTLGEAAGLAAYAKLGAKLGTKFNPGLGTAVGALVGMIGGSIGMWAMAKVSKAIVGQDVADKVEAEKLAQTQDGQMQILQTAYEAAQKGDKHMDAATQQALYRVMNTMA